MTCITASLGINGISLRSRARRGIAEFTPEDEKWLAIYDKLPYPILDFDVGQFCREQLHAEKPKANAYQHPAQSDPHNSYG